MLNIDLNSPEFISIFTEESKEIIDRVEKNLLDYEETKNEKLNGVLKRDFHTLKGSFNSYEIKDKAAFFHKLESKWSDFSNLTNKEKEELTSEVLDEISNIRDFLDNFKGMEKSDDEDSVEEEIEKSQINEEIVDEQKAEDEITTEQNNKNLESQTSISSNNTYEIIIDFNGKMPKDFNESEFKNFLDISSKLISYDYLGNNVPKISELEPKKIFLKIRALVEIESFNEFESIFSGVVDDNFISIKQYAPPKQAPAKQSKKQKSDSVISKSPEVKNQHIEIEEDLDKISKEEKEERTTIRVNTRKLNDLGNLIGEIVVKHSALREFRKHIKEDSLDDFDELASQLTTVTKDIQDNILSIRMIPIGSTFTQFKRTVRSISRKLNKDIDFELEGENTEIDKIIVEKIVDPIGHMLRNSVDHGIESKEEREKTGKNPVGKIRLKAYHEDGEVVIEVFDDGRGLDKDKIVEKAISKNIISTTVGLTDSEIYSFIFEPDFSTRETVTDVSGRGVGMDVVKNNIKDLRGKIEIESKKNEYSLFKIKLPLTLLIIDGMIIRIGLEKYILPVLSIVESMQPQDEALFFKDNGQEIIMLRNEEIPLVRMHNLFGISGAITNPTEATIFIVETYKSKIGLMVDEVIDHQQIVVKKMHFSGENLNRFSGATVLGNGEVALILDVKNLHNVNNILATTRGGYN